MIIAGFSTMVASLYAVTTLLMSLSKEGYAPKKLSKKGKLNIPMPSLFLTTGGLVLSITLGFLLPDSVYEYITTAAGLMLLYNWLFILFSGKKLLEKKRGDGMKHISGIFLILLAVTGALARQQSRPGFYISLGFLVIISIITLIMNRRWKKEPGDKHGRIGLFERLENI